jgi:glutaminase
VRNPVPDYLHEILDSLRDDRVEFSIQSISKPFAYAAALIDRGADAVDATVGVEPSGEAFNELSLEGDTHRPKNPMINAGALAVHHLLAGDDATTRDRVTRVVEFLSELAGSVLTVDEEVYRSEIETADRNLAIVHMLRNYGVVADSAHPVVDGYTRQCAVRVTVRDLAVTGATLANAGVQPVTGNRVVPAAVARRTLEVMAGCGMYDAAGDWLVRVGIPAKSGVAGGLLGAVPGRLGLGMVSPRLDTHGNSVRGVAICERLSRDMGMHLMEANPTGSPPSAGPRSRATPPSTRSRGHPLPRRRGDPRSPVRDAISTSTVTLDLTRVDRSATWAAAWSSKHCAA